MNLSIPDSPFRLVMNNIFYLFTLISIRPCLIHGRYFINVE